MRRVVLESRFAGNVPRNIAYAKRALADSLRRGEASIASHLLFTQPGILDDTKPEERSLGMAAGHAWIKVADAMVVYEDYGVSSGMRAGIAQAHHIGVDIEYRKIGINP